MTFVRETSKRKKERMNTVATLSRPQSTPAISSPMYMHVVCKYTQGMEYVLTEASINGVRTPC